MNLTRFFDLIVSSVGLILLSPLFLILAVLIKIDSKGPVFFKSERIGLMGKPFRLFKFRSMVCGADQKGPCITVCDDNRITAMGSILRKTKLDELPQLINVFGGDMTLVGPRPEDPHYVARYSPEQRRILNTRPGITSPASIEYHDEESLLDCMDWETVYLERIMPRKIKIDLNYLERKSLLLDLKIIWFTVGCMFHSKSNRSREDQRDL